VRGLDKFSYGTEGKTDPGNDNRPAFDATVTIDALFERGELEDFVHREFALGFDFAFDRDGPGRCAEFLGVLCGGAFVDAEFVEIVVMRYVVERIDFFGGAKGTLYEAGEFSFGVDAQRRGSGLKQVLARKGG